MLVHMQYYTSTAEPRLSKLIIIRIRIIEGGGFYMGAMNLFWTILKTLIIRTGIKIF